MNGIVGKNIKINLEGKDFTFSDGLHEFYNGNLKKIIFNLPQTAETSLQFTKISKKMKKIFSHVAILKLKNKTLIISDGFINPNPNIKILSSIVSNSIFVAKKAISQPVKVAILSAVELVAPAMDSAIPASVMEAMGKRKQFGKDVFVEGPLSIDVAVSEKSAEEKKVKTDVAGSANILIGHISTVPNGIITALKNYGNADYLISIVTDGTNIFPFILDIMDNSDISKSIEFCNK